MKSWKILKDWTTDSGLRAVAMLSSNGNINGYVEVTEKSKYYGLNYYEYSVEFDDIEKWRDSYKIQSQRYINNIEIHGGLTYAELGDLKYLPSKNWWFGFDTAHAWDKPDVELALEHFPEMKDSILRLHEMRGTYPNDAHIRDLEYVVAQCEKLANQLKGD